MQLRDINSADGDNKILEPFIKPDGSKYIVSDVLDIASTNGYIEGEAALINLTR
ncbi:hypothetical protein AB3Y13_05490 [Vibrio alginolyticus]